MFPRAVTLTPWFCWAVCVLGIFMTPRFAMFCCSRLNLTGVDDTAHVQESSAISVYLFNLIIHSMKLISWCTWNSLQKMQNADGFAPKSQLAWLAFNVFAKFCAHDWSIHTCWKPYTRLSFMYHESVSSAYTYTFWKAGCHVRYFSQVNVLIPCLILMSYR